MVRAIVLSLLASAAAAQPLIVGPERPLIEAGAESQTMPVASSSGNNVLVAWREPNAIAATIAGSQKRIELSATAGIQLAAVSVGARHFVIWRDDADRLLFARAGGAAPQVSASSPSRM